MDPIWVVVSVVVLLIAVVMTYWYLTTHKPCVDCERRTKRMEGDEYLCGDCSHNRKVRLQLEKKRDSEPKYTCPIDSRHGVMEKIIAEGMITDKCTTCGTVVLTGDELDEVKRREHSRGYNEGRSSASSQQAATNAIVTAAVISSINN